MQRGLKGWIDARVLTCDVTTPGHSIPSVRHLALFWGSVLSYLAHYNHTGIAMFMFYGSCQYLDKRYLEFTSHCLTRSCRYGPIDANFGLQPPCLNHASSLETGTRIHTKYRPTAPRLPAKQTHATKALQQIPDYQ
jgi:hypothetical protein